MLITSHGHADHYANIGLFADAVNSASAFVISGTSSLPSPSPALP